MREHPLMEIAHRQAGVRCSAVDDQNESEERVEFKFLNRPTSAHAHWAATNAQSSHLDESAH
ncbi:hypothetical protein GCM10010489_37950 [Microbacterium saperdae]|nr:hypothetical protein GCM10010489_37950 [Microbacterium saperdae]